MMTVLFAILIMVVFAILIIVFFAIIITRAHGHKNHFQMGGEGIHCGDCVLIRDIFLHDEL